MSPLHNRHLCATYSVAPVATFPNQPWLQTVAPFKETSKQVRVTLEGGVLTAMEPGSSILEAMEKCSRVRILQTLLILAVMVELDGIAPSPSGTTRTTSSMVEPSPRPRLLRPAHVSLTSPCACGLVW
ncbi:hypothetical protein mRhiFer1_010182 [Rhinolophus ferrumequinum]|uniref:Uncharacterized protein n=1 Tax=Rhinolophus ferrumequinum TaxID=59479 RepID=A0A7J7XQN5_RHIFE|nr:hypothetical protein mRhiFer1_010182 [Rhinolophus ferrumequinum]